jgi:hypothetical protein
MGGEAFASTGWRDFSTMFGDSVFNRDYVTSIKQGNYLFTYGCGAGSYTTCQGIGATSDFNNDSINTVFTMLFGSYFGDWDSPNNFLRAPLCSRPSALASAWSGRPYWQFHPMSTGEPIGYCAWLTQNNYYDTSSNVFGYVFNIYPTFTHVALMGDPSLRLHPMMPSAQVKATPSADSLSVKLSWSLSADGVNGYVILRSHTLNGKFSPIATLAASDSAYTDMQPYLGSNYYLVRPLKLEHTPSGTYYNLALGVMDSTFSTNKTEVNAPEMVKPEVTVFPNPATGWITVFIENHMDNCTLACYDITGRMLVRKAVTSDREILDLTGYTKGLYILKIQRGTSETVKKIVIE